MNRVLLLATGLTIIACGSSAFAQSSSSLSDVPIESTTPNASVAQNFQYMNHPPVAAPASSTAQTQGGRGHRRRQSTGTADSSGADSSQP
jgi:hypothetical protein